MPQSLSSVLIHLIFSTKQRQPQIFPEITDQLYAYMTTIANTHGSRVHEIGGIEDHVRLLISLPRTVSLNKIIEEIKKGSSKWIKTKGSAYSDFAWQNGYGAFSIGQSGYEDLKEYIQKQKEHHKKISFQDEYRLFLKNIVLSTMKNICGINIAACRAAIHLIKGICHAHTTPT